MRDVRADLQSRRDELARRMDAISTQADAGWEDFKRDVNRRFDALETELSQTASR